MSAGRVARSEIPPERLVRWLLRLGARPHDDRDLRILKASLVGLSAAIAIAALAWVVPFYLMGFALPAAIPFTYQVVTALNLAVFARTGSFRPFLIVQVAMWLVFPFIFQWTLGGFAGGSVVMIWSFLSAVAALLYFGRGAAVVLFTTFVVLVAVSVLVDPLARALFPPFPEPMRTIFFGLNIGGVSIASFGLLLWVDRQRRRAQARSETLLRNVLPTQIADRLIDGESRIAEAHADVTVLFADIVEFTPFAQRTAPAVVVDLLDRLFSAFDVLAERNGLEKIKTIGDAYMVVAGLPSPLPDHAAAALCMALDMQVALRDAGVTSGLPVELRIGVATGPVIAGVIGERRILYDLWGDTVNTASRMESQGLPGRIQVTAETRARLADRYRFEQRDGVQIKGKGTMTTYLVLQDAKG